MRNPLRQDRSGNAVLGSACTELPVNVVELSPNTLKPGSSRSLPFRPTRRGNTVHDSSGNLRDGVLTGGQWFERREDSVVALPFLGPMNSATVRLRFPMHNPSSVSRPGFGLTAIRKDTSDLGQWGTVVSTELGLQLAVGEVNVDHQGSSPVLDFGLWKDRTWETTTRPQCACFALRNLGLKLLPWLTVQLLQIVSLR